MVNYFQKRIRQENIEDEELIKVFDGNPTKEEMFESMLSYINSLYKRAYEAELKLEDVPNCNDCDEYCEKTDCYSRISI